MPIPSESPDSQQPHDSSQMRLRKVTDPGLTDEEREVIARECRDAGGHYPVYDPSQPQQFGRCVRCNKFIGR